MIVDPGTLAVFGVASMVLIAVPRPAVLQIVTRSMHRGRRARNRLRLGIGAGALCTCWRPPSASSALLASPAIAFSVVK